jgi:hypothetical protein
MTIAAIAVLPGIAVTRISAQPVTFEFDAPIDLGSNLARIDSLEWSHILGTEWDTRFQIGGIVGQKDATVIPAIPNPFGPGNLIDPIVADTRTGVRMTGHATGSTGLKFYADLDASGLESGTTFDFEPRIVDLPGEVNRGEFTKLATSPGLVFDPTLVDALDLPAFEAGMDFFFNLDLDSTIDYGLFPVVPYGSARFQPDPIHIDQSLIKFEFDLDPDANNGKGLPPTFVILEGTPFEDRLGLLNDDEYLAEKSFSVEMSVKGEPVKRKLDIGSAELVNPFGKGDSILGPEERNLTVTGSMSESSLQYSFETAILRLGLDLDGIAAYLGSAALTGAGHSFTHFEQKFANDKVSVEGDWIDVKYGPEIGYRETVKVEPDFEVTLNFDREVAINNHGQVSFANSFTGKWSDLPGIAVLGDEPIEVTVSFDRVTGKQTKRGVFYLTDYLELTLVEVGELKFFDAFEFELPALYSTRTSLFGNLLGQAELEVTNQAQAITPFDLTSNLMGSSSFTLNPIPSTMVYLARSGDEFSTSASAWRELATHAAPDSIQNAVLVIASGSSSSQVDSDLLPERIDDEGGPLNTVTSVAGLVIPEGSTFTQSGARSWSLSQFVNDGQYSTIDQGFTRFGGIVLSISGRGEMRVTGTLELDAVALSHGPDHKITLGDSRSIGGEQHRLTAQQFHNGGQIMSQGPFVTSLTATQRFSNPGTILTTGGDTLLTTPLLVNDGRIEVRGPASAVSVNHPAALGQINIQSTAGTGQFIAADGATLRFLKPVLLDTPGVEANPLQFQATGGGTIQFDGILRAIEAGVAQLEVDETSKLVLNGIYVERPDALVSLVNKGVVEVQSGENRLYFTPIVGHPSEPPPPEAEIVGINVVNEGTIRIRPRAGVEHALFGFQAEIVNYVPGGATLGRGTWELIGQVPTHPYKNDKAGSSDAELQEAILEILVSRVSNQETYLGRIDFGDSNGDGVPDGYSVEDYDTSLAVSEANVLLSGAARFDYFNTIRENRGSLTLRNKNHFDTAGGLVNKGAIRVEVESRLNVMGDFTVDEGTVFVDSTSVLDVEGNTIEVIGGNVTVQRGAVPLLVNTPWIVREKWVGLDSQGNDLVREARVSYGGAWFPTIGPSADILVEGKRAVFEPLTGVDYIQGKLTLTGGNELHLGQGLSNEGTLKLTKAGKLYVDGILVNRGQLVVGRDAYLDVTGEVIGKAGSIKIDGVLHTANITTSAGTVLNGAGRLTGSLSVGGTFLAQIAGSNSEDNELFIDGEATLGDILQVSLDGYIPGPDDLLSVLNAAGGLAGAFSNVATGQRLSTIDGLGSFLVHYGIGSAMDPNRIILAAFELAGDYNNSGFVDAADYVVWRNTLGQVDASLPADGNGNGTVDAGDYDLWRANFGKSAAGLGATGSASASVPEPAGTLLLVLGALTRRARGSHESRAKLPLAWRIPGESWQSPAG